MNKADFLNVIEEGMGIRLTRYQLDYFFNNNMYRAMSTPRRGGKDFIAAMDLLYSCASKVGSRVLIGYTTTAQRRHFIEIVNSFMPILESEYGLTVTRTSVNIGLDFSNTSRIVFVDCSSQYGFRGQRCEKAIIMEPDFISNDKFDNVYLTTVACTLELGEGQVSFIGTHMLNRINLLTCMMNPYMYKIQARISDMATPYTPEELATLREEMPTAQYELEITNMYSANILSSMFEQQ